jgi:hypothetical protein
MRNNTQFASVPFGVELPTSPSSSERSHYVKHSGNVATSPCGRHGKPVAPKDSRPAAGSRTRHPLAALVAAGAMGLVRVAARIDRALDRMDRRRAARGSKPAAAAKCA